MLANGSMVDTLFLAAGNSAGFFCVKKRKYIIRGGVISLALSLSPLKYIFYHRSCTKRVSFNNL